MKTQIFSYNGVIGVFSPDDEGYLNNPEEDGQLGTVVRCDCCEITPEAKKLLQNAKREGGSFSSLMLTKHSNPTKKSGKSSFGYMGFKKAMFAGEDLMLGRDCDKSVLEDMTEKEIEVPEDFKAAIDEGDLG
jgi:DNA-binding MarR family transcriptional regulator